MKIEDELLKADRKGMKKSPFKKKSPKDPTTPVCSLGEDGKGGFLRRETWSEVSVLFAPVLFSYLVLLSY